MSIVLAISRQLGSGGSAIGQAVASRLGLRYADRDILREAALALGVDEALLEPLEERVRTFWDRMAPMFVYGGAEGQHYTPVGLPQFDQQDLFAAERRIIREIAAREDAVIVGRGAAQVLRGHPGLVSIYVHAPEAVRVRRIGELYHLSQADAQLLAQRTDRQRAAFIEALAGRPWTAATLYDLTLDTEKIGLDASIEIVTGVVRRKSG
jgi:cytidylate kinase